MASGPLLAFDTGSAVVSVALALPDRGRHARHASGPFVARTHRDDRRVAGPRGSRSPGPGRNRGSQGTGQLHRPAGWTGHRDRPAPGLRSARGRGLHLRGPGRPLRRARGCAGASGAGGRRCASGPLVRTARAAESGRHAPGRRAGSRSGVGPISTGALFLSSATARPRWRFRPVRSKRRSLPEHAAPDARR